MKRGFLTKPIKKNIPLYAKKVGIVTASTGAAIQDIINISTRRNPYVELILYPAIVQGEQAKASIIKGIQTLDGMGLDVIIVGRGGGSIEDLWGFNEEEVARAIYECKTPIISAVGHETDTTIADFVSDLRAPTPSAAAELAVCNILDVMEEVRAYQTTLINLMKRKVADSRNILERHQLRLQFNNPSNQIMEKRQYLMDLENRIETLMELKIKDSRHKLAIYMEKMNGLSPINKLNKGFAYVQDANEETIKKVSQVKVSDVIVVKVMDGDITAAVTEVTKRRRK